MTTNTKQSPSDQLKLLRNMPVFGGLKPESLQTILELTELREVVAGDHFFSEGDPATSLYVLREGTVRVEKRGPGDEPIVIRCLKQGDCFGEMSLIDLQPRSATVTAQSDCTAIEISLKTLHELYAADLEQYAIIMMNMGREVSRRLRTVSEHLFELQNT